MAAAPAASVDGAGCPVARRHIGQRLRGVRRIERVGEQHGVVHRAAQRYALRREQMESGLPIVGLLGDRCIFKQCAQFARQRQAQSAIAGSAHTPTLKLACFSAASATSSSESDFCGASSSASSARALRHPARRQIRARARLRRTRLPASGVVLRSISTDGRRRGGRKFAQHRGELQLGEEFAAGLDVRRLRLHCRPDQAPAARGCRW